MFIRLHKNAWKYNRFSLSSRNGFKAMDFLLLDPTKFSPQVWLEAIWGFMSNTVCENFDLKKKLPTKRHEIKHMFILLKKRWLMKGKQTTSLVSTSLFLDLLHSWPNPKLAQPLGGGRCAQLFQSM